jgi:hypothetical protein
MDIERLVIHRELQYLRALGWRNRRYINHRAKLLNQAKDLQNIIATEEVIAYIKHNTVFLSSNVVKGGCKNR